MASQVFCIFPFMTFFILGDANLLCGLVNQFVLSNSEKLLDIIAVVRQPLDKVRDFSSLINV